MPETLVVDVPSLVVWLVGAWGWTADLAAAAVVVALHVVLGFGQRVGCRCQLAQFALSFTHAVFEVAGVALLLLAVVIVHGSFAMRLSIGVDGAFVLGVVWLLDSHDVGVYQSVAFRWGSGDTDAVAVVAGQGANHLVMYGISVFDIVEEVAHAVVG